MTPDVAHALACDLVDLCVDVAVVAGDRLCVHVEDDLRAAWRAELVSWRLVQIDELADWLVRMFSETVH